MLDSNKKSTSACCLTISSGKFNLKSKIPDKSRKIESTLIELKNKIGQHYNERLQSIILYGSYARGDFNEWSDIDILVVLNEMQSAIQEIDALAELKTDILLDSDIYISTNPVSIQQLNFSEFQFYKNIRNEGIVL